MKTPYEILGVAADAGDAEIKQAYLQQVKAHPPDRDQALFQTIHGAYEAVKDLRSRTAYALFHVPEADFGGFLDSALKVERPPRLSAEHFIKLLAAGSGDADLLQAMHQPENP